MGKIKQGILGGFSGKVANVVGSSWKGIAVMKSLPLSVANPRTAAQVAQRTKFSNVTVFAALILSSIIKPLWDRFAQNMSGFNDFVSTNIDLFAASVPSPFADLVISKGKMLSTTIDNLDTSDGLPNCDIYFIDDTGSGYKLATDKSYAVVINETNGDIAFRDLTGVRSSGVLTIEMPNNLTTGDVLHAYLSFIRADGTVCSNNSYATATV